MIGETQQQQQHSTLVSLCIHLFTCKGAPREAVERSSSLTNHHLGSFPQTAEVRRLRFQFQKNTITEEEYDAAIHKQIAFTIGIQESLGWKIFVHGEAEPYDMVEFFAENMDVMIFSNHD